LTPSAPYRSPQRRKLGDLDAEEKKKLLIQGKKKFNVSTKKAS